LNEEYEDRERCQRGFNTLHSTQVIQTADYGRMRESWRTRSPVTVPNTLCDTADNLGGGWCVVRRLNARDIEMDDIDISRLPWRVIRNSSVVSSHSFIYRSSPQAPSRKLRD